MGSHSPLGCELSTFWERLLSGTSGISRITRFDPTEFPAQIAGEVCDFEPSAFIDPKNLRRMDPFTRYGVSAAKIAVTDSGLDVDAVDGDRVGVLVGSGIGGLGIMETQSRVLLEKGPKRLSPFCIPQMIGDILTGYIAIEYGFRGPNFAIVSACTTSAHSLGEATRMIQRGDADVMIAGGAEAAITRLGVGGFAAMKALSTRNDDPAGACRPFDADRDGFVVGEGGGVMVLEALDYASARGARIYAELAGYGLTCDAFHITAPDVGGEAGARAMTLAMNDAGISAGDIDYINAHGTGTELNDKAETIAVKKALGEAEARRVTISSTKSMTGHLLGAAGVVEAIACVLAIQHGVIPPTINYATPDPDCDLDYTPNEARKLKVNTCLSNSLAFGGHNATLVLRKV